ncbi:stage II sporulation protein P [Desulforamulus reducens]|uniref:stage II sporulation protein P n=1 Tax=Desulforamulus reducens TaxID=59610 RepID=UPI00006B1CF4|nr:stage II sporulation protein P [Desulforamulus reducens]
MNSVQFGHEGTQQDLVNAVDWVFSKISQDPRSMILTTMPALAWQDTPEEMERPGPALWYWLAGVTRFNLTPESILQAQIPMLAQVQGTAVITVSSETAGLEEPPLVENLSKDVLVGIYNTHTGETYSLTDGTDRLTGKQGGVVLVAKEVQRQLAEKHAIRVALSDKVHDARYATSYLESEKTVRQLVANNPSMITMLDIHRDAGRSRENCLVEVKGKKTAPILIIVGSDARLPFPNWKQNYQFACKLADKLDQLYPGLCLGVRVKEGRYNQFLHPGAILVEVGSDNNSLEEAKTSAVMLADALAEIIKEELKKRDGQDQTKPALKEPSAKETNEGSEDKIEKSV